MEIGLTVDSKWYGISFGACDIRSYAGIVSAVEGRDLLNDERGAVLVHPPRYDPAGSVRR